VFEDFFETARLLQDNSLTSIAGQTMRYPDCTELYRRIEVGKQDYARLPGAEKLAIAARLRDFQEELAPLRAKNKAGRSDRKVVFPLKPDHE
jgi:hypothetical protein